MLVIDCICYNGEPVAEFRMQYLREYVDEFVLVEAAYTHSGTKKSCLYSERNREALLAACGDTKLTVLIIDAFPPPSEEWVEISASMPFIKPGMNEHWFRERYQRNFAFDYISQYEQFVVFVCDADEIPNRNLVRHAKEQHDAFDTPIHLMMSMYLYNFTNVWPEAWHRAFVVNEKGFKRDATRVRIGQPNAICRDAGVHCTFFMSAPEIIRKLKSFAHGEHGQDRDEYALRMQILAGEDLLGRGLTCPNQMPLDAEMTAFNDKMRFLQRYG